MLIISIIQTIRTAPGGIPEDKEWDMQTDSMAESSSDEDSVMSAEIRQKERNE
jgi:hypothetical protein